MIRLGVCTSPANAPLAAEIGYDYVEFSLASIAAMPEEEFEALVQTMDALPISVEAFNGMLPGEIRVTGPNVSTTAQSEYLEHAFARAKRLGGQVFVFGSSAARNVPDGFPIDVAWRQVDNFLRLVERHAVAHDITVAIEPLRRKESNIINYVSEAVLLSSLHQLPHIRALGDTFHMAMGAESLRSLTLAGDMLAHMHTANAIGRKYPKENDGEDYAAVFKALHAGGYSGRVSIEAGCTDFATDAKEALQVLIRAREVGTMD